MAIVLQREQVGRFIIFGHNKHFLILPTQPMLAVWDVNNPTHAKQNCQYLVQSKIVAKMAKILLCYINLRRLHQFCNFLFQARDDFLFQSGYVGLRNAKQIGNFLLSSFLATIQTKAHFDDLFFP